MFHIVERIGAQIAGELIDLAGQRLRAVASLAS